MEPLLKRITYKEITDHLFHAEEYWYGAFPGIHSEVANALIEATKRNTGCAFELVIDTTELAFRGHHGDVDAIAELLEQGVLIKEIPGHRLGFIISDKSAWFLFTQSRAIEKDPTGYNAIRMSATTKNEVLLHFFGRSDSKDIQEEYVEEMRELVEVKNQLEGQGMTAFTPPILDEENFEEVTQSLKENPPTSPDFKRLLDVYSTKIKFIEFEVKGIKLDQRTITIPTDVLNLVNEELRNQITTRLHIFDKEARDSIKKRLSGIEKQVETIRDKFLKRVASRNKSVIKAEQLLTFKNEIETLNTEYDKVQDDIEADIRGNLITLKKRLKSELKRNFEEITPDELTKFKTHEQFPLFLDDYVEKISSKIHLPTATQLMKYFEVNTRVFDPTYEDFKDQDFISELEKVGFISRSEKKEIVEEFEAIAVQIDESSITMQ